MTPHTRVSKLECVPGLDHGVVSSATTVMHPSVGPKWPSSWTGRGVMSVIGRSVRAFADVSAFMKSSGFLQDVGEASPEPANWPSRPLRIGLVNPGGWATGLVEAAGAWDTEWFTMPDGSSGACTCREYVLDALVRPLGVDGLEIDTNENAGLDAAWFDWGFGRPLSYSGVFPARFDPARVTLATGRRDDARLLRALVETAALLARHPIRLTAADRVHGRRPFVTAETGAAAGRFSQFTPGIDGPGRAMRTLATVLPFATEGSTSRAASRVLGSFLAASAHWENENARVRIMDVCGDISGDEPETLLRLAAVRLGMGQDEAGIDALERADRMLRDNQIVSATSQAAFISAELEHGHPGPLTIGRLAAGICMLVSTMPAGQVAYFRDDLFDDMRFCSLLIGRDQDRRLLMEVFRMLERVRRAESFGLPAASEAMASQLEEVQAVAEPAKTRAVRKPRAAESEKKSVKKAKGRRKAA